MRAKIVSTRIYNCVQKHMDCMFSALHKLTSPPDVDVKWERNKSSQCCRAYHNIFNLKMLFFVFI